MSEATEIQMARMQEQMKILVEATNEARQTRKETYQKLELISSDMSEMKNRLNSVESTIAGHSPTIAEFIKVKQQVEGAGKAGKWLWAIGGILIGAAFTSRELIRKWLLE